MESTSYYYKVAAVDTSGNVGVLSDEANTTTGDSTAPSKVLDLAVTTISGSQLDLAWTANTETDLNHYNIYRGTDDWLCCKHSLRYSIISTFD